MKKTRSEQNLNPQYGDEEVFECLKEAEQEAALTDKRHSSEEVLYAMRGAIEEAASGFGKDG